MRTISLNAAVWFCAVGAMIFCASVPALAETCAPEKLIHVRIVNISPGIPPGSFAGKPINYYRLGSEKLRVEEESDVANGIHGLIVTAAPDTWMVNLYDRSGRHIVDPGPTYNAKVPVLGVVSPKLETLEVGCEANFIAKNAPQSVRTETVGSSVYDVYRVVDDADAVEILERPKSSIPTFIRLYRQRKLTVLLRYDVYETGLDEDPNLFVQPPNITYTEAG